MQNENQFRMRKNSEKIKTIKIEDEDMKTLGRKRK